MRSRGWKHGRVLRISPMLLGAIIICLLLMAAPINAIEEEAAFARPNLVVADQPEEDEAACVRCHEKVVRGFVNSPHANHGRPTPHGHAVTCASCHGTGQAHIQSAGDKSKIFNPAEAAPRQVDDGCLRCHAGKHVVFEQSAHGRSNTSCVRCHSIHSSDESEYLLSIAQPALCFECHEDQRRQFSEPFRHKVAEGILLCTDCHEAHGSSEDRIQRSSAHQDFICTKCHTDVAGPFEYEHAIIKTEGCTACHSAHGGPTPHMLNRATVNTICLLCHFPPLISSKGGSLLQAHGPIAKDQFCTDCHADIHGSNVSAVFLKKKK